MFFRNCPECNNIISYKSEKNMINARLKNKFCKKCSRKKVNWSDSRKKLNGEFKRSCPKCKKDIIYKAKNTFTTATKNNSLCQKCNYDENYKGDFKRKCNGCGKELHYSTITSYRRANKFNATCISCSNKIKLIKDEKEKLKARNQIKKYKYNCYSCNKIIWLYNKIDLLNSKKNNSICKKCAINLIDNINDLYRKCEGCGVDIFYKNKKMLIIGVMGNTRCKSCTMKEISNRPEVKKKRSESIKGEKNPMYGKPPANNDWGWGWSGKYRQYNFRSLLELNYIMHLLREKIKFESAEKLKYSVDYIYKGSKRKYYPDFYLIDKKEIIEVKPKYYFNDEYVMTKINYALKKYGDKYKVITEDEITPCDKNILIKEYKSGNLLFNGKYDRKFKEVYLKEYHFDE